MHKQLGVPGCHRGWPMAFALAVGAGVPMGVSAQIAFDNVSIAAGFGNSNTETWGASWGDLDGDHYPDIFVSNHRMRAALYHNNRDGTFTDVSQQVDLSHTRGWTGGRSNVDTHGATWVDIDNDGDEDLYQSVSSDTDILSINNNGLLTDGTLAHGIDHVGGFAKRQHLFFDYNGDGLPDIATMSTSFPALYSQKSDGTFNNGKTIACNSAQWGHLADLNGTGGLELICAPRTASYPKVNTFPGGVITDITAQFPVLNSVNDAAELDYNGDLLPDLFLVRNSEHSSDAYQVDAQRIEMQINTVANKTKAVKFETEGTITLTVSTRAGAETDGDPTTIWIGSGNWRPSSLQFTLDSTDPNNWGIGTGSPGINIGYLPDTGEWEISQGNAHVGASYVQVGSTDEITGLTFIGASATDIGTVPFLMTNTGSGLVRDSKAGFTGKLQCESVVAGDFDNDMHEDIFLACTAGAHNLPNRLFRNLGNGKFAEVPNAGGAAGVVGAAVADHAGASDSVVVADYDLDGFLDLFVVNGLNMRPAYMGGPKQLFHNRGLAGGNTNHWMEFDLVGTTSNRDGTGSKVYVTAGGVTQYREQNGGYHRSSQNFMRVHVGLATNTQADTTVVWPDGSSMTYSALAADHVYQLKQDGTVAQIL
jgi:hypothetical protein